MDALFGVEPLNNFQNVLQEIINNLYNLVPSTSSHLDTGVFIEAKNEVKTFITDCNFDIQDITSQCYAKGWPEEKIKCFINLFEKSKTELLYVALNHYNSTYGETIVNFDWVLKFILGTSELKTYKYPLLQLLLSSVSKNGQNNKSMYDINKDVLSKMINILESIQ